MWGWCGWLVFKPERHLYVWLGVKMMSFVFLADWRFSLSRSQLLWKSPSLPPWWNLYEYWTGWVSLCLPRWLLWKELRNWYFCVLHVSSEIWNYSMHSYVLVSRVAFLYARCCHFGFLFWFFGVFFCRVKELFSPFQKLAWFLRGEVWKVMACNLSIQLDFHFVWQWGYASSVSSV